MRTFCRYEQELAQAGKPKTEIRKPRYMQSGNGPPDHPGGSKDVNCALCPVKRGIFKQTTTGKQEWVHVFCALTQHPEVTVASTDTAEAVRPNFLFGTAVSLLHVEGVG